VALGLRARSAARRQRPPTRNKKTKYSAHRHRLVFRGAPHAGDGSPLAAPRVPRATRTPPCLCAQRMEQELTLSHKVALHNPICGSSGTITGFSCGLLNCVCAHTSKLAAYRCFQRKHARYTSSHSGSELRPTPLHLDNCVTRKLGNTVAITHVPVMNAAPQLWNVWWRGRWCVAHGAPPPAQWRLHAFGFVRAAAAGGSATFEMPPAPDVRGTPPPRRRPPRPASHGMPDRTLRATYILPFLQRFLACRMPDRTLRATYILPFLGWASESAENRAINEALWSAFGHDLPPPPSEYKSWLAFAQARMQRHAHPNPSRSPHPLSHSAFKMWIPAP